MAERIVILRPSQSEPRRLRPWLPLRTFPFLGSINRMIRIPLSSVSRGWEEASVELLCRTRNVK